MVAARYDMHCHLGFASNLDTCAQNCLENNIKLFIATVTPQEYLLVSQSLSEHQANQHIVGLGAHPWWISHGELTDQQEFLQLMQKTRYLSEIGLDFSNRFSDDMRTLQMQWFNRICQEVSYLESSDKNYVMSIHAIKAVQPVLDVLKDTNALEHSSCIFHWFSGSSQDLKAAIDAGCYFSINRHTLGSKRWKEYLKVIPRDMLLLETDMPSQSAEAWTAQEECFELNEAFQAMQSIRSDIDTIQLGENSRRALGLLK